MAILVLHLVTLPFMCQVWMSPGLDDTSKRQHWNAEVHVAAPCPPIVYGKIPKNPQNYIYLTFCEDGRPLEGSWAVPGVGKGLHSYAVVPQRGGTKPNLGSATPFRIFPIFEE